MNNVHVVTLGCSKNEVDTSVMQSILDKDKYNVVKNPQEAEIIIVNTCGFIESAKQESIDTILEACEYKKNAKCKKILVAGCLAQRYSKDLLEEIPEIDGIIGTGNLKDINYILDNSLEGIRQIKADNINDIYLENAKRLEVNTTEYVKISEGCNNNCAYCIIPKLRGKNRSRKIEDIKEEVKDLVQRGAREIILIAQNTTDYGIDLYKKYSLAKLIREISTIEDLKWIRVLYLYPDHFTDELISEFKNNEKLLNYIDIPLQHISDNVLQRMNRHTSKYKILDLINKLRKEIDSIVIRTTFIVGFPGETQRDFVELKEFIKAQKFDKLGVFTYSKEEDTKAYFMEDQISEQIKLDRQAEIMELQKNISEELLQKNIGKTMEVLIEQEISNNYYESRSYMDCPEIDGVVYVDSNKKLEIGNFYTVLIKDSLEYDLIGEII